MGIPDLSNRGLKAVLSHQDRNWNNQPSDKMQVDELTPGCTGCLWEQLGRTGRGKANRGGHTPRTALTVPLQQHEPLPWNSVPGQD